MKSLVQFVALCGLLILVSMTAPAQPVPLIYDTDMGNDIDDALALAMIHALESRGECELLAVTLTKDNRWAAPFVDLVNTVYGRGDIPIGVVRGGKTPEDGNYNRQVVEKKGPDGEPLYPHDLTDGRNAPGAAGVLRKVLAAQPDGSVVIAQVGFSTNLARLLDSNPDDVSPLSGPELIKKKVKLLSVMAGDFAKSRAEYNVKTDRRSAEQLFREWPGEIVVSGFEIGEAILYAARSIEQDYRYVEHHPVAGAYRHYMEMPYDRPTWDLTSVLYGVRPERGYFELSKPGKVWVDSESRTHFEAQPGGKRRYLIAPEPRRGRILEALTLLASQPPQQPSGR